MAISINFWALKVTKADSGLFVSQTKYTLEMLQEAGIINNRPYKLLVDPNLNLQADVGTPLQDPKVNSLYVHPSAGSCSLPIQETLVRAQNYRSWRRSIKIVARAPNAVNVEMWETCNNLVISWIMSSVCESIAKYVMFIGTASEIWSQLETRFSLSNGSRKYKLCKDMFGISAILAMEKQKEEERLFQVLNCLDDCYSAQRTQLLLINPLSSVENACAVIQQEES
ncbi:hypothetical protein Tco_0576726 [Tanacetum coccineum]